MRLKVVIRRNEDNMIAETIWGNWEHHNNFWWQEGGASCDCNRYTFFKEAMNEKIYNDIECSENLFSVRLFDADTGEVLYKEF
jgi:hypothetical protein